MDHVNADVKEKHRSTDNGKTWIADPDEHTETPEKIAGLQWWPARRILDERNDVLMSLSCSYEVDPREPFMGIGNKAQRTRKMFYRLSRDGGGSWTKLRQVVDSRPEYDQTSVSADAGMTWSEPTPLVYDNGETVWTPASVHSFFTSSKTGKTYLLANILPGPVHSQMPRYPLAIAEFDIDRCCVLKDTVSVIQDLPEAAPTERRYTNWGQYEERGTGDLILIMPEQPGVVNFTEMTKPEDFTSDCIKFRIRIA